jgi:hypothetical protein
LRLKGGYFFLEAGGLKDAPMFRGRFFAARLRVVLFLVKA